MGNLGYQPRNQWSSFIPYLLLVIGAQSTLPETNIAPENRPSQKETSISTTHFQVRAVSFREGIGFMCLTGSGSWRLFL